MQEQPKLVCLKGKIHQYGADLSLAPPDLIYIGRRFNMGGWKLPDSKWRNPFPVKEHGRDKALELYRTYLLSDHILMDSIVKELAGKTLACWCDSPKEACHGDILISVFLDKKFETNK